MHIARRIPDPNLAYESFDQVLALLPQDEQESIAANVEKITLRRDVARLKGSRVRKLSADLNEFGAKLIAKLPNGEEVELSLTGM